MQLVLQQQRAAGAAYGGRWRVLADRSGPFFTVVIEFEAESLAHWAEVRAQHFEDPAIAAALVATQPWITGGTLELYTVEAEG